MDSHQYIYTFVYVYARTRIFVCIHISTYKNMYIYTHISTQGKKFTMRGSIHIYSIIHWCFLVSYLYSPSLSAVCPLSSAGLFFIRIAVPPRAVLVLITTSCTAPVYHMFNIHTEMCKSYIQKCTELNIIINTEICEFEYTYRNVQIWKPKHEYHIIAKNVNWHTICVCTHNETQTQIQKYTQSVRSAYVYRAAKTHRMPDLYRLFSTKNFNKWWLFCGKRRATYKSSYAFSPPCT